MAFTFNTHDFTNVTTLAGTLKIRMYYEGDALTEPTAPFKSIGPFVERIEEEVGAVELPTVDIEVAEDYSEYTDGFWFKLFTDLIDGDDPLPLFRFYLDEGDGDTHLYSGIVDVGSIEYGEPYLSGSSKIRTVRFQLVSDMVLMSNVTWATVVTELTDGTEKGSTWLLQENPLDAPSIGSVTNNGTPDTYSYAYRIAARDASGEYEWCAAVGLDDGPQQLNATDSLEIAYVGVTGATDYAVYRTTDESGLNGVGFIGLTGDSGAGNHAFTDTGFAASGTGQSKLSARKFVKVTDIIRAALLVTFDEGYTASCVTTPTASDVEATYSTSRIDINEIYVQFWENAGSVASPSMGLTPYFNSADAEYLGNKYGTLTEIVGAICKNFALFPRATYDTGTPFHVLALSNRGRNGNNLTMSTNIIESTRREQSLLRPFQFKAYRLKHEESRYTTNESAPEYDVEIVCLWNVQDTFAGTYPDYADFALSEWEKIYYMPSTTANVCDGADYYDYGSEAYVSANTTYTVYMEGNINVTGKFRMQEALVEYFKNIRDRRRRTYRRIYGSIKATDSTTTHTHVYCTKKAEIADGINTHTYYATEVSKDPLTNTLEVTWVQQ